MNTRCWLTEEIPSSPATIHRRDALPLVGTICCQDGKPKPFAECIRNCRERGCQHPLPILVSMSKESEKRDGIGYSSSTLSQCPRQHVLAARNDYYESPDDYYPRWMGTLGHLAVEASGPYVGISQEVRYHATVSVDGLDVAISGQPDWYDTQAKELDDYKYTAYPPREPRPEHEAQLNVYAWLLENNGLDVDTARVIYLHPKNRQTGKRQTTYDVSLWSPEAVERYITAKLLPHVTYLRDGNLVRLGLPPEDAWKAQFCPFRHSCNPGRCCTPQIT
jgi:hypothetical protein